MQRGISWMKVFTHNQKKNLYDSYFRESLMTTEFFKDKINFFFNYFFFKHFLLKILSI